MKVINESQRETHVNASTSIERVRKIQNIQLQLWSIKGRQSSLGLMKIRGVTVWIPRLQESRPKLCCVPNFIMVILRVADTRGPESRPGVAYQICIPQ